MSAKKRITAIVLAAILAVSSVQLHVFAEYANYGQGGYEQESFYASYEADESTPATDENSGDEHDYGYKLYNYAYEPCGYYGTDIVPQYLSAASIAPVLSAGDFTFANPRDVADGRIEITAVAGLSGSLYFTITNSLDGLPGDGDAIGSAMPLTLGEPVGNNIADWQWLRVYQVDGGNVTAYRELRLPGHVIGTLLYGPTDIGAMPRGTGYAVGDPSWENYVIEASVRLDSPVAWGQIRFFFRHGGNQAQPVYWGAAYRVSFEPSGGGLHFRAYPPARYLSGWGSLWGTDLANFTNIQINVEGNEFSIYANGSYRMSASDSDSQRTSGWVGIHTYQADITVNNFRINRIRSYVEYPDNGGGPVDPNTPTPASVILNNHFTDGMNHWTPQNDSSDPNQVLSSTTLGWWDVNTHGPHTNLLRVGANSEGAFQDIPGLKNNTTHFLRIEGVAFNISGGDNLGIGIQRATAGTWHTLPFNNNFGLRTSWFTTQAEFEGIPQAYIWKNQPGSNIDVYISEFSLIQAAIVTQAPTQYEVTMGQNVDIAGLELWVYDANSDVYVRANNAMINVGTYDNWAAGYQNIIITYNRFGRIFSTYFTVEFVLPYGDIMINNPVVSGVRRPMLGREPVTTITTTPQFTGTVVWNTVGGVFGERSYTATITLTPALGFTLDGVPANFFTVEYATSVTHDANSGVITAVFPALSVGTIRDITAMEFVQGMRVGWNLGNTLDAHTTGNSNPETVWMPHVTTREMIETLADAGFDILRVPVTWTTGSGQFRRVGPSPTYTIAPWFLDRVEEVVNWGLDAGMYVIINVHHDTWKYGMTDSEFYANRYMAATLWTQIATHFVNYCDRLIFATMNEPMQGYPHGGGGNWTGAPEYYHNVNRYNQWLLDTIRATGGNNQRRFVMVPTYAAGAAPAHLSHFVLPTDMYANRLIASVHSYAPTSFTFGGMDSLNVFNEQGRSDVNWFFNRMNHYFISNGIPVIVGEFGSQNKNNTDQRAAHAAHFVNAGRQLGIPSVWWDNYTTQGGGERFGLFNRGNNTFFFPEIVDAMMDVVWNDPDPVTLSVVPVFDPNTNSVRFRATVSNVYPSGQPISGRVELASPANFFTNNNIAFQNLEHGQNANMWFSINPNFVSPRAQELLVFNVIVDGFTKTVYLPFTQLIAGYAEEPITIDGTLSDEAWQYANIIDFARGVIDDNGTLASTLADLSATGMVTWDEDYLYIAVTVNTPEHFQNQTGGNIWQGDGIQVSVRDSVGFREMGFAKHNDGTITQWCWLNSTGSAVGTGEVSQTNARSAIVRNDATGQTIYEIAIRWDYLGFTNVSAGDIARISLTVNDNHNGTRRFIEYGAGIAVGAKGDNMGFLFLASALCDDDDSCCNDYPNCDCDEVVPVQLSITFNPNGGMLRDTATNTVLQINQNTTLRDSGYTSFTDAYLVPTRDGYNFIGWFMPNGTAFTVYTSIAENLTVIAHWTGESTTSGGGVTSPPRPPIGGNIVVRPPEPQPPVPPPSSGLLSPPPPPNNVIFTADRTSFILNGIEHESDIAPFIDPVTNRMMAPLRVIVEAFGYEVEWCSETRSALIHLPTGPLRLPVGEPLPNDMGMPYIINGRMFVPLRFIMEAIGANVEWDSQNRAAIIYW